jgi:hypothetical protein
MSTSQMQGAGAYFSPFGEHHPRPPQMPHSLGVPGSQTSAPVSVIPHTWRVIVSHAKGCRGWAVCCRQQVVVCWLFLKGAL